jgi:hypothetical protein
VAENKPINLMAGLRNVATKPGQQKMAIQVTTDDVWFDPDNKPMANAVAAALVAQIKANIKRGCAPDGQQLPTLTGRSLDRRHIKVEQGNRAGAADSRYSDTEFRAKVQQNYHRDFSAAKLGTFRPLEGSTRGVLSGMLAESFFARPAADGKTITIYVAAKRGRPRPSRTEHRPETQSALESVFGKVPLLTPAAMQTPELRAAMQQAAEGMIAKSIEELHADALGILKGLAESAKQLQEIGETSE